MYQNLNLNVKFIKAMTFSCVSTLVFIKEIIIESDLD